MRAVRILIVVSIFGWFTSGSVAGPKLKDITLNKADGYVDFDIPLTQAVQVDDGGWIVSAQGLLEKVPVGFDVRLKPEWKSQDISGDGSLTVYWGAGAIIRSGPESDSFCALLQNSYNIIGSSQEMPPIVETTVVSLGTDPHQIAHEPLTMKMFYKPTADDAEYAEFFLNVDLIAKVVQFHEKDIEYRTNIIRAFCRSEK